MKFFLEFERLIPRVGLPRTFLFIANICCMCEKVWEWTREIKTRERKKKAQGRAGRRSDEYERKHASKVDFCFKAALLLVDAIKTTTTTTTTRHCLIITTKRRRRRRKRSRQRGWRTIKAASDGVLLRSHAKTLWLHLLHHPTTIAVCCDCLWNGGGGLDREKVLMMLGNTHTHLPLLVGQWKRSSILIGGQKAVRWHVALSMRRAAVISKTAEEKRRAVTKRANERAATMRLMVSGHAREIERANARQKSRGRQVLTEGGRQKKSEQQFIAPVLAWQVKSSEE